MKFYKQICENIEEGWSKKFQKYHYTIFLQKQRIQVESEETYRFCHFLPAPKAGMQAIMHPRNKIMEFL